MGDGGAQPLPTDRVGAAGPLDAVLNESEPLLVEVRAEIDGAWDAAYRSFGLFFLVAGVIFLLEALFENLFFPSGEWAVLYYLYWVLPFVFIAEGLVYLVSPGRMRRFQKRQTRWLRQGFFPRKTPDSRLAEMVDHLRTMRREIDRIERMVVLTTVGLILFAIVLALVGVLTAGATYLQILRPGPDLSRLVELSTLGGGCVGVGAFLLLRSRRYLRTAWKLSDGLQHAAVVLAAVESQFLGRA